MWFNILKMPNPYGGRWAGLTREQYYKMSDKNKQLYHSAIMTSIQRLLQRLRARHQPLATAPAVLENELKALQEKRNFHGRQEQKGSRKEVMAFNAEDEQNRRVQRLHTTPMGNALEEITEEEYNAASTEDKMRYHRRTRGLGAWAHDAFQRRMQNNPNYIPPYNPKDANIKSYSVEDEQSGS